MEDIGVALDKYNKVPLLDKANLLFKATHE
jgi:hypothetical protein